jgi:hypothetical protein
MPAIVRPRQHRPQSQDAACFYASATQGARASLVAGLFRRSLPGVDPGRTSQYDPLLPRQGFAELMGECPEWGAITTQVLKLAWQARVIACSECLAAMPVDEAVLQTLRHQAVDATTTIDRLTRVSGNPTSA